MPMGPGGNIFFTPNFTQGVIDLDKLLGEFEGHLLRQAIAFTRGDKAQAAKLLGVSTAQFPGRLKKHGIS
jgi:DNA-binding NtrC family response regulator